MSIISKARDTVAITMYITGEVDLPLEVIEAHADGRLVLFIGAGVSRSHPSSLPLFDELAAEIGSATHLNRRETESVDHFLGRISETVDVHTHVARIIGRTDSLPNSNHEAIAWLASSMPIPRVITTNFDAHLESAAVNAGLALGERYVGPALPVGRDFHGIAYLHGVVTRRPTELVVTDRDFGRAYMTDAWASRFLREVFDNFVVLFVGYSHTDPIVSYLGLGLPSNAQARFVLTHEPDDERWEHLGIRAIGYSDANDHSALPDSLGAWARRSAMGQLDHRTLVERLSRGAPPNTPVEHDYLSEVVQNSVDAASTFSDHARGPEWLAWVEQLPAFEALFREQIAPAPGSAILARWFANNFLARPDLQAETFLALTRHGLDMTDMLFEALNAGTRVLAKSDPSAARRWLVLLATSVPGHSAPRSLTHLAMASESISELTVLEQVLRPRLRIERNTLYELIADAEASARGELIWAVDYFTAVTFWDGFKAHSSSDASSYLPTLERSLALAHELLLIFNGSDWDSLSFRRSAIEPHPQDEHPETIDLLIDGIRDAGEIVSESQPELAQRWLHSKFALFRRLAVHLVSQGSYSASEKLQWVMDNDLLWDYATKHERFVLIRNALNDASSDSRNDLLRAIESRLAQRALLSESSEGHDATEDYETYNLLVWIADSDLEWEEAAKLRDRSSAGRDWEPREHPDLHSWTSSGFRVDQPPFTEMEFDNLLSSSGAEGAISSLLAIEYGNFSDLPEWSQALVLVRNAVAKDASIGVSMWESDALSSARQDERADLFGSVLQGWTSQVLDGNTLATAVALAGVESENLALPWYISRFLAEQLRLRAKTIDGPLRDEMRRLARVVWDVHAGHLSSGGEQDVVTGSLNSWPGNLARFWILEVSSRWQSDTEAWTGFDVDERTMFDLILDRKNDNASRVSIPALAREVVFLFNADPDYATRRLIPLFGGDQVPLSWSWGSYLYHPSWNDGLLANGFFEKMVEVVGRLSELDLKGGLSHQMASLIVNVVTFSDQALERRFALLEEVVIEAPNLVLEINAEVSRRYSNAPPDRQDPFWEAWLRDWTKKRVEGVPRTGSPIEMSTLADLVPHLAGHAHEAFNIMKVVSPPFSSSIPFPEHFDLGTLQADEFVVWMVARLRNTDTTDYLTQYRLKSIGASLRRAVGNLVAAPFIGALLSLSIEIGSD